MKTHKQELGAWGEDQAVRMLEAKGYRIVERNFRLRTCELDIIAWQEVKGEKTLCFIEVKTREGVDDGSAQRATDHQKLKHMFQAAKEFCLQSNISLMGVAMRFEQVSVYVLASGEFSCKHYIIPID